MNQHDLRQIDFVTRKFKALQGLRTFVPTGLMLLGGGLTLLSHEHEVVEYMALVLFFGGGFFLMWRAPAYYAKRFGVVLPLPAKGSIRQLSVSTPRRLAVGELQLLPGSSPGVRFAVGLGAGVAILIAVTWLHPGYVALARLIYLTVGSSLLYLWWADREHRLSQAYPALLGLLLLVFAGLNSRTGALHWEASRIVAGGAMVLCGLLDHLQLVRVLGPVPSEVATYAEEAQR
jgi:hypothetical protein